MILKNQNRLLHFCYFLIIFSIIALVYLQGWTLYFHQDDFVHASFSQNLGQVIGAFNPFEHAIYPFFRPISTQLYWFLGQTAFGFNPLSFHLLNFIVLCLNCVLISVFATQLGLKRRSALMCALFFGFNSTHMAPMFSSAYVQEILVVTFSLLSLTFFVIWLKKQHLAEFILSFLFYGLAICSKETALVLPGLFFLCQLFLGKTFDLKKSIKYLIPFAIFSAIYLILRFEFYGLPQGSSYHVVIGKPTLNILVWYFLWALSTPNILIDFIGPGLKVNPVLFKVAGQFLTNYVVSFIVFIVSLAILFLPLRPFKLLIFSILWFVVGVCTVIIFPWHHLAVEQSISLIGLSLFLGQIVGDNIKNTNSALRWISLLSLISFIFLTTNTIQLGLKTHWIANGAKISKKVFLYLSKNNSLKSGEAVIYFKDEKAAIPTYGTSKQISLALGGSRGIPLMFHNPKISTFFQFDGPLPKSSYNKYVIVIGSNQFLQ